MEKFIQWLARKSIMNRNSLPVVQETVFAGEITIDKADKESYTLNIK